METRLKNRTTHDVGDILEAVTFMGVLHMIRGSLVPAEANFWNELCKTFC